MSVNLARHLLVMSMPLFLTPPEMRRGDSLVSRGHRVCELPLIPVGFTPVHLVLLLIFFFQAEDGIRAGHVTGVQTCALPICPRTAGGSGSGRALVRACDDAADDLEVGMAGVESSFGVSDASLRVERALLHKVCIEAYACQWFCK